jgi:hypothetical protein
MANRVTASSPAGRRAPRLLALLLALCAAAAHPASRAAADAAPTDAAAAPAPSAPRLLRIRVATISAPDLHALEAAYAKYLGYRVRERGRVPAGLAASWGAARVAGRPYLLMSTDGWPDVYIRAVQGPSAPRYEPMTTWGWNAIEIIVEEPDQLRERLRSAPFEVIGEPAFLSGNSSIRAFQVRGAAREVLYLTSERGDRAKSTLPLPNGFVGRPFIMVLAGPDIGALTGFYARTFALASVAPGAYPVSVLQHAQHLGADAKFAMTIARLGQHGNVIEFDEYPALTQPRPRADGELPPGVAMASFSVASLEGLDASFIRPPVSGEGAAYRGKRSATLLGAAGELVELIEE